jgi:HD-GYP domain-containing protein (c-di-GMP phosphodiesterase class II)
LILLTSLNCKVKLNLSYLTLEENASQEMHNTIIKYPVLTLAGKELLAAGDNCSAQTMKSVITATATDMHNSVNLMAYGTIEKDLKDLLTQPPYHIIFAERELREEILSLVSDVTVPLPMLETLDYFKEYDSHTYRHMLAIYVLSMLLAGELDPSGVKRNLILAAGPSHDLGKINVPIDILNKSQPLTDAEADHLHHHAMAGYVHLSSYFQSTNSYTAHIARDHHERLDGSGYPRRIRLQDPLMEIIAIADIYDALISPRPYRSEPYDNRTAIEELTRMAELGQISWDILKILVVFNRQDKPHNRSFNVSLEKRGTPPAKNSYGKSADPAGDVD